MCLIQLPTRLNMACERRGFLVGLVLIIFTSEVAGEPEVIVSDTPLTFAHSQQTCRSNGVEYGLPLYQGQANIALVHEAMDNNSLSEIWLPLRRKRLPTWTWLDGQNADEEFKGQQLNANMNCGLFHLRDVILELDDCAYGHLGYLCETQERCSSLGVSQTNCRSFKNRTLVYGCGINNWYDARYQCRKQNMDLAIISDKEVKQFLHETWYVDNKKKCMNVWVGFRRDDWVYDVNKTGLKDDPVFPMYWESKAPSHVEDCVTVLRDNTDNKLYWKTRNCSSQIPGLCVKGQNYGFLQKMQPSEPVTPTPNSDAGYNPGVAVGVVVTCLIVVGAIIGVVIFMKRKKVKSEQENTLEDENTIVQYVISDPSRDREDSPEDETLGIDVDTMGGSLQHRDSGITLDVPIGAVPTDEDMYMSLHILSDKTFYQSPPGGMTYISPIINVQMKPVTPLENFAEISIPHQLPRQNIFVYHKHSEVGEWTKSNKFSDSREAKNRLHHEVDNDKVTVKFKRFPKEGIYIVSTCETNMANLQLCASMYAARKRSNNRHFRLFACVYHSMHKLPRSLMRKQFEAEREDEEANVNEAQPLLRSRELERHAAAFETGNSNYNYVHLWSTELFKPSSAHSPNDTLGIRTTTDNENWRIEQDNPQQAISFSTLLDGLFPWVVVKYRAIPKDGVVDLEEFMVDQVISLKNSEGISLDDEGTTSVKWKFKVPVKKEKVKLSTAHIATESPTAATYSEMQEGAELTLAASENKNKAATDSIHEDTDENTIGFPVQTSESKQNTVCDTEDATDRTSELPAKVLGVPTIDLRAEKKITGEGQNKQEGSMDLKEASKGEKGIAAISQDETKDLSPQNPEETPNENVGTGGGNVTMEQVDERQKKHGKKEKNEKKKKKKKN